MPSTRFKVALKTNQSIIFISIHNETCIKAPESLCYLLMYINPTLNKDYLLIESENLSKYSKSESEICRLSMDIIMDGNEYDG
jgi:hypothetical protein